MLNDIDIKSLYDATQKDPCKSLFFAVVLQAILDVTKPEEISEASEIKLQRGQAHAWVFCSAGVTCENFEETCAFAGLEPVMVRTFALKVINSGDVSDVRRKIHELL